MCLKSLCPHRAEIKSVGNTEPTFSAEYTARGGVNVVVTFCLLACYMIPALIPALFDLIPESDITAYGFTR